MIHSPHSTIFSQITEGLSKKRSGTECLCQNFDFRRPTSAHWSRLCADEISVVEPTPPPAAHEKLETIPAVPSCHGKA